MEHDPIDQDAEHSNQPSTGLPASDVNTGGGHFIGRDVNTGGGHFIGRDNIINIGALKIPFYLAVIVGICMISIVGLVGYPSFVQWLPKPLEFSPAKPDETLILVATFYVTEGNQNTLLHREIRNKIREKVKELGETQLRVEVESTMLNSDQRAEAEVLAKRYNASMVIWGDDTGARVIVNFLNLRQPDFQAADIKINETERTQLANPNAYARFITDDLPRQMTFFALFSIGQSYYLNTQYSLAIERIESAVSLLPHDAQPKGLTDAYFLLGWLYNQAPETLNKAFTAYRQAILLDPNDASAYNNRGLAYAKWDYLAPAINDYNRAITLDPDSAQTYSNRGLAYARQGNLVAAITDYNQAISLDPNNASAYYNRAIAYYAQDDLVAAIADYDKAIELDPDDEAAYNNLCWTYSLQGHPELALPHCQQAIALNPLPNFYDSQGVAHALLGDFPTAITEFQTFVDFLEASDDPALSKYLKIRKQWIAMLKAGNNPFTQAVLDELKQE